MISHMPLALGDTNTLYTLVESVRREVRRGLDLAV